MNAVHDHPGKPGVDKRRFSRITFAAPAQLVCPGGEWISEVIDLSLKGALLSSPAGWSGAPGDICALRIPLDAGAETEICMQATVAHTGNGRIGLKCHEIDIDSLTHLRRLVELNLANEDLLQRELGTLSAE